MLNPDILAKDQAVPDDLSAEENIWPRKQVSVFLGNSEYTVVGSIRYLHSDSTDYTPEYPAAPVWLEPDFDFLEQELNALQERLERAKLANHCAADYMWKLVDMAEDERSEAFHAWKELNQRLHSVNASWQRHMDAQAKVAKEDDFERTDFTNSEWVDCETVVVMVKMADAHQKLTAAEAKLLEVIEYMDTLRATAEKFGPHRPISWTLETLKMKVETAKMDLLPDDELELFEGVIKGKKDALAEARFAASMHMKQRLKGVHSEVIDSSSDEEPLRVGEDWGD